MLFIKNDIFQAWAAQYWHKGGVPKDKLVIGVAAYGRGFQLADKSVTGVGSPVFGPSLPGNYTNEAGLMAYYEES